MPKKWKCPAEHLEELGDTEAKVRASLWALKVRGVRNQPLACPLARFLESRGFAGVAVAGGKLEVGNHVDVLPDACAAFVRSFDAGKYAELAEEEPAKKGTGR